MAPSSAQTGAHSSNSGTSQNDQDGQSLFLVDIKAHREGDGGLRVSTAKVVRTSTSRTLVRVAWLKEVGESGSLRTFAFHAEQSLNVDPEVTTFNMLKSAIKCPAPIDQVRVFCPQEGLVPSMPAVFELGQFANNFEFVGAEDLPLSALKIGGGRMVVFAARASEEEEEVREEEAREEEARGEEARRVEKKKAKKKGKKEKQRERRKARPADDGKNGVAHDDDEEGGEGENEGGEALARPLGLAGADEDDPDATAEASAREVVQKAYEAVHDALTRTAGSGGASTSVLGTTSGESVQGADATAGPGAATTAGPGAETTAAGAWPALSHESIKARARDRYAVSEVDVAQMGPLETQDLVRDLQKQVVRSHQLICELVAACLEERQARRRVEAELVELRGANEQGTSSTDQKQELLQAQLKERKPPVVAA